MKQKLITIDGPSASGKGTVATRVAAALGWRYLDSGALYRLTALFAHQQSIDWGCEEQLATLAAQLPIEFRHHRIWLDGQDVTDTIRTESIGQGASQVAQLLKVREALLICQRAFLTEEGLVADGRDMGSIVFPEAPLKIFLTASVEIRAQRRAKQLGLAENDLLAQTQIIQSIKQRDEQDSLRTVAPLIQLPEAHLLDTSFLTIDESVKKVIDWYHKI